MENERSTKIIAIAALVVGIVGLSIGFAAFSQNLTIGSLADVKVSNTDFKVQFSLSENEQKTGVINAKEALTVGNATDSGETVISSNATTISNLGATFTAPGQSLTYEFYVRNNGEYDAYLNDVLFQNANGGSTTKVCTPKAATDGKMPTDALVQEACEGIPIILKVGEETYTTTTNNLNGILLEKGSSVPVSVTIRYAENSARADGDFAIKFGDIQLVYSSAD